MDAGIGAVGPSVRVHREKLEAEDEKEHKGRDYCGQLDPMAHQCPPLRKPDASCSVDAMALSGTDRSMAAHRYGVQLQYLTSPFGRNKESANPPQSAFTGQLRKRTTALCQRAAGCGAPNPISCLCEAMNQRAVGQARQQAAPGRLCPDAHRHRARSRLVVRHSSQAYP